MIGALISGAAGLLGAHYQNRAARAASARQMAFQERMSGTSFQRAVKDMRKAGINPLLAYKTGGASTPAGSTYNPVNIGAAGAQGYMQGSSSAKTIAETGIQQRTLDMLVKENITLPELQFTAKNIFTSKMLRAFEAGLRGDTTGLTPEYAAIANKISGVLRDAGLAVGGRNARTFRLDSQGMAKLFGVLGDSVASVGYEGVTDFGMRLLQLFEGE